MILPNYHPMETLRELWTFRSFRARIFLAILPTTLALITGHFALDRQRPYDFHEDGSYIEPPSGHGGDIVTVNWHVSHHRTCEGTVERQLVDPNNDVIIATYDPTPAALNGVRVGERHLRKSFALPHNMQPGTVAYQAKLSYQCNWLQELFPGAFSIRYTTPKILFKFEG